MPLINFLLILLSLSFGAASTSSYSISLDVCQVITVVESVTILSTYIPKNTAISIDSIKTITITNAPTTISSIITISSTLSSDTQSSPSADNAPQWTTSTVYRAHIYTITSCGPTVTDCPAHIGQVTTETTIDYTTVYPLISSAEAPDTKYYTTVTTDKFITVCPTPTTFTHGTQTYTVTDSSTITITDCPCTFTHSFTPSASSTSSTTSINITDPASTIGSLETKNSSSNIPGTIGNITTSALSSGSNLETSTTSSTVSSASSLSPSASFIVGIVTPGTLPKKRQDTKSYLLADGRLTSDCSKAIHLIISEGRLLDATNPTSYYSVPPHTEFENFLPNSPGAIPNGSVSTGFSISLEQELVWNPGFDSIVDVLFTLNYQGIVLAVFDAFLPPDSILVDLEVISLSDRYCPGLPSATTSLQPSLATLKPSFGTSIPSLKSSKLSLGTSISSLGTPIPSASQGTAIQSSGIFIPSSSVMWTNSSGPAQPTPHTPVTGISTSAYLLTTSLAEPTATSNTSNSTTYSARNASLSSVTSGEAPSLAAVTLSSIAFLESSESSSTFGSPSSTAINGRSGANSSGFAAESLTTMPTSISLSYRFTNSSQMMSTTSSSVIATVTSEAQSVIAGESSIIVVESFSTPSVSTISAYSNSSLISFTTSSPVVAISTQVPLTSSSIFLHSSSVPFVPMSTSTGNSLEPGTTASSIFPISSSLFTNGSGILSIPSLAQSTTEGLSSAPSPVLLSSSVYTAFASSSNTPIVYSSSPIFLSTSGAATTSTASSSISSSSSIETGSFVEASTLSSGSLKADSTSSSIPEGSSSGIKVGISGTPLSTTPSSTSESDYPTSAVDSSEGILFSTSQPLVNSTVSSSTLLTLPTSLQSPPESSSASNTLKLNTSMPSQGAASSSTELPISTIQSSAAEMSMQPSSIFSKRPSGTSSLAEPSTFIVSSLLSIQSEVSIDSAAPSGESSIYSISSFPSSSVTTINTSSYMVILTATSVQENTATTSTSPASAASAEVSSPITLTSSSAAASFTAQEFLLAVYDHGQPFAKVVESRSSKRRNSQKYGYVALIGDTGCVVTDESDASLFTTDGSHLFANGKYCGVDYSQVASGYGIFQAFSTEPDISTVWDATLNQQLRFTNTAFTLNGFATVLFCMTSEYVLFNEYTSEYPDDCTRMDLLAELPSASSSSTAALSTISEFSTSTESSIPSSTVSSSCSSSIAPTPTCGANQVLANPSFEDFDCDGPLSSPWSSSGHANKRSSGVSRIGDESSPIYTGGFASIYVKPNVNPSDIFQSVSCLDTTMIYSASFSLEIVSFEDEDMQASSEPSCILNVFLGNTQMTTIPVDNLPKTGYNYITTHFVVPLQPSEDFRVVLSCGRDRQATCLVHVTDFTLGPRGPAHIQTTSSSSSVPSSIMKSTVAAVSTPISIVSSNSTSATTTNSVSLCLETSVIVNGNFEDSSTDIDPWTLTNAVQPLIERGPGFPYSGNNTLLIYKSDLNATEVWSLNQTVQTCSETPYLFSFYARANGDNSTFDTACPISVCFDGDCQLITTLYNHDFGYSQYYRLFNGFPYATNLTVSIESGACGQYVFIDDVTFDSTTPGYTPPAPTDVIDCLGGTTRESCTNILGCYWSTYYEHCYDYSYGSK